MGTFDFEVINQKISSLYPPARMIFRVELQGVTTIDIHPSEFEDYLADPAAYCARKLHVGKEQFLVWLKYMEDEQRCSAMTSKGEQCLNKGESFPSVQNFVQGVTDRCSVHVDVNKNSWS